MEERIKVMVVEDEHEERNTILEVLSNVEYIVLSGEAESREEAEELMEAAEPDVVIVGARIPGDGYRLTEKICSAYPGTVVIIIESSLEEETMRKAIFAGAKDVLVYPFTPSKLVDSIYRSFQMEKKKRTLQKDKTPRRKRKRRQGQVLSFFSTKGGVGKTFVSVNTAVALAETTSEKVVLVDLDLDFGNAALALNVVPRYTISDVINEIRDLDQDLIESYLIPHRLGIKLLAANAQPQMAEFINAEHVEIILKVLQSSYDYVVVDLPPRFYDPVNPAFQQADKLFLITAPEISTLRNIKATLSTFEALKYPKSKIKLLLNRAESRGDIRARDVEKTLNYNLYGVLPADYKTVTSSLNKGIPVVLLYPRSHISRAFMELARRTAGGEEDKMVGRSAGVSNRLCRATLPGGGIQWMLLF